MSLQEILNLPTTERLKLIEQIWDSINKEDIEIYESQKKELDRRITLHKENKAKWLSFQEMKDQLRNNF